MYTIKLLRVDHVLMFAAEELKKYLRMMMPQCGDIAISFEPGAKDGFRLGLAEDFGLTFEEAIEPVLDDVVHIETDAQGGILTGSNPRSVLFAVYRLLKENGCRFLYPGVDGEYIPVKEIEPVSYHHMADHRFRGQCNEGGESQQCMLETIDFYAKLEMNTYMLEFDIPYYYYDVYYSHKYNEKNRPPEPVTAEQVLQWKRQCEAEIAKRGLQFHDMGHGWTAEPYGLSSTVGWNASEGEVAPEIAQYLAQMNGERKLFGGVPLNTNLCMSKPEVRTIMAKAVADYAENHQNVTYIHVWLADGSRNHCECEECQKLRPSDYYMMIMNELDEELERRGLDSKIVFIAYVDTLYAPEQITIKNPKRFALLYAPIQRSYTSSVDSTKIGETPAFERNKWLTPVSAEANAAFLRDWQKNWKGSCFCYEYHFWKHVVFDPGMMAISRRIYEDIVSLKSIGIEGIVEDGSQRAFFPNGFAIYIYAEALRDRNCNYEQVREDYFRHIYGDQWEAALSYLERMSETFDFAYMEGERSADPARGKYYNPDHVAQLQKVKEIAAEGRALAESHMSLPVRVQTVSMRLLLRHAEYCEKVAEFMMLKAAGQDAEAREAWLAFCEDFGRYDVELDRYYDHSFYMIIFHLFMRMQGASKKQGEE